MKLIATSQRINFDRQRGEYADTLDQRLAEYAYAAGGAIAPIPNNLIGVIDYRLCEAEKFFHSYLKRLSPDAILLSGGEDISCNEQRDFTDMCLLNFAARYSMPVLGICRGMQVMAHWAGGSLKSVQGHVKSRHLITGEITGLVNSYHKQSIDFCPIEFEIIAKSEDNEIEAIKHKAFPWEGWMWHPERENKFCAKDIGRFKDILSGK